MVVSPQILWGLLQTKALFNQTKCLWKSFLFFCSPFLIPGELLLLSDVISLLLVLNLTSASSTCQLLALLSKETVKTVPCSRFFWSPVLIRFCSLPALGRCIQTHTIAPCKEVFLLLLMSVFPFISQKSLTMYTN